MNDSHSGPEPPTPSRAAAAADVRGGAVRPVLWVFLVVCVAGDMVAWRTGVGAVAGVSLGLAALACAAGLIVHHYRNRPG
ncbi:hypothetical protein ETD83_08720 [Actinomadura soli]|uniref:Uncharacterized protein n=1 Tax=Actinomadura soli TaxID=2508997 RepID=A0A5C4JG86_9ACTN|nr:hypothetical protein [Actinomadura soli]TMR04331.1 hypothetical protein ETD83_08720 [Actinomadura soli]